MHNFPQVLVSSNLQATSSQTQSRGDRPQRSGAKVLLNSNYCFLFYFRSDNTYNYFYAHSGVWTGDFVDNLRKVSLQKDDCVELKEYGVGLFITHGPEPKVERQASILSKKLSSGASYEDINLSCCYLEQIGQANEPRQDLIPKTMERNSLKSKDVEKNSVGSQPKSKRAHFSNESDDENLMPDEGNFFDEDEQAVLSKMDQAIKNCAQSSDLVELGQNLGFENENQLNQRVCSRCLENTQSERGKKVIRLF